MSRGSGDSGWDRNRARLAVGEGFPCLLFRLQDGFTFSPWRTVPEAPLKSWTVGFPEPSSKPWHVLRGPSHGLERFKRWFMYTPATPGLPTASPPQAVICERPVYQAGPPSRPRRPPSVQSPFAQLGCYLRWGDVVRLLGGRYPSVIARTGSCAAPVGLSPPSVFSLVGESLQVVTSPCCPRQLPDVIPKTFPWMLDLRVFVPRSRRKSLVGRRGRG